MNEPEKDKERLENADDIGMRIAVEWRALSMGDLNLEERFALLATMISEAIKKDRKDRARGFHPGVFN